EHLAVELDLGLLQPVDELVVREAVLPRCRIDADDPEPPELALLVLAVAVRVDERVLDLLLRVLVRGLLEPPVALRLLEDLAALLARVDGPLHTGHRLLPPPQELVDGLRVALREWQVAREEALTLLALLPQIMALHCAPAQQLARSRHLEPLLGSAVCLLLWHRLSSPPHSSSARAA